MSEYREIRGSLQGERCEHKSWADLCEKCEIDRLRAEVERLLEDLIEAEKYNGYHQQACLENERLRAALERFACTCDRAGNAECSSGEVDCPFWQARAALEGKHD